MCEGGGESRETVELGLSILRLFSRKNPLSTLTVLWPNVLIRKSVRSTAQEYCPSAGRQRSGVCSICCSVRVKTEQSSDSLDVST